jgi:hypothetical protein
MGKKPVLLQKKVWERSIRSEINKIGEQGFIGQATISDIVPERGYLQQSELPSNC